MSTELLSLLLLAALVLANVALEFVARWRNPPIGEFLAIDGVRLHFIMRGDPDAPPLVMFHGNGALLQDLTISGLVDAASKKFRVICFDRPGFGHSSRPRTFIWSPERQAELFAAALTRLGVERMLVLGHSWGTLVALAMAASRDGKRVKGLVLISGYYFPTWRFDVWFAGIAAIPVIGDALRYTISPISSWLGLPLFAKKTFAPRPVPESVKREYPRLMLIRPSQLRAVAEDSAFLLPSAAMLTMSYRRLKCPTAIIAGRDDEVIDSEQAVRLQKAMPHAAVTLVPEAGHMVHYFVTDQIVRIADVAQLEVAA
ncbi:MAG TPA: alpha/beta hydrolase [Bryobacteraceae bacterium]|nr:alpha/beta hydrolase [Bryobacteraceae bacterium]